MINGQYKVAFQNLTTAAASGNLAIVETETDGGKPAFLVCAIYQDASGHYDVMPIAELLNPNNPTNGYRDPVDAADNPTDERRQA